MLLQYRFCPLGGSVTYRIPHDADECSLEEDAELRHAAGGETVTALGRGRVLQENDVLITLHHLNRTEAYISNYIFFI